MSKPRRPPSTSTRRVAFIEEACAGREDDLASLKEGSARKVARRLVREINDYAVVFAHAQREANAEATKLDKFLTELDVAIILFWDLSRFAELREKYGERVLWQGTKETQARFLFENLLLVQMNTLLAVRRLLRDCMTGPARVLIRSYIEHFHLLIAIVAEEPIFQAYAEWANKAPEDLGHWREKLTPKKMMAAVDRMFAALPAGTQKVVERSRRENYAMLSGTAHGHPIAVFTNAYTGGRRWRDKQCPALGGRYSTKHRGLCESLSWINFELFSVLLVALTTRHGWRVPAGCDEDEAREGSWLRDKWVILRSLHFVNDPPKAKRSPRRPPVVRNGVDAPARG